MQLKKAYLSIFTIGISLLFANIAKGQSTVHVHSPDSVLFQLKVNTILVTDSLVLDTELYFFQSQQANLVFSDSAGMVLLDTDISVADLQVSNYDLKSGADHWSLELTSVFDLVINPAREMNSSESNSEITEIENSVIPITSNYQSFSAPNKKDLEAIDELIFERDRIRAVTQLISEEKLTSKETVVALSKISFEDKRAEIIILFSDILSNKLSAIDIDQLFKLEKYESEALKSLGL